MCDSFRLTLDWAEGVAAPATIVAKCPSHDEASRNIAALTGTYVQEVSWDRELAAGTGLAPPHPHHAATAAHTVGVLLRTSAPAPAPPRCTLPGEGVAARPPRHPHP